MAFAIVESPYAALGHKKAYEYVEECYKFLLGKGHTPFASHYNYTVVLNDMVEEDRQLGMGAGHNLIRSRKADFIVVFTDYGISSGMRLAIDLAKQYNVPIMTYDFSKDGHDGELRLFDEQS